jgi:RNA polymerase sigma factor (sigma-70 family)
MKLEHTDISQLIDGCKKNDRTCQRKIYEMLYGKMMSVCLHYCSSRDEAHDVLQDGFIKVFEKIGLYNNEGVFEGWVRRIIVNTAIDAIRKKKHEFLTDDTTPYQKEVEEDENDSIYSSIKPEDILNAMHTLSPMYRTVFNMYVMEGMNHQEIAEELNISVGTSKSNLFKAKANMKTMLMNKLNR